MDVIGFGALNYDLLYKVDNIAAAGGEVAIKEVRGFPGGSAANTIFGLARLGFKTGFIGCVGDDNFGRIILDDFSCEGVDISNIKISGGKTGTAISLIDKTGERTLYVYPGANDKLSDEDVCPDYVRDAEFLHLTSMVNEKQFELQKQLVKKLFRMWLTSGQTHSGASLPREKFYQKTEGVKLSFAPGEFYAKKGLVELKPLIERSYLLFLNRKEIEMLTGCDYREGSKEFIDAGVRVVAVTLGKDGCFVASEKESHLVSAEKRNVADTTGAGDAFASGFLSGLLTSKPLDECGKLGNIAAGKCIEKFGAREGLPSRGDLEL